MDPNDIDVDVKNNLNQILYLADKLKYLDPMYTTREGEVSEMGDPGWLNDLRNMVEGRLYEQTQNQTEDTQQQSQQGKIGVYFSNKGLKFSPKKGYFSFLAKKCAKIAKKLFFLPNLNFCSTIESTAALNRNCSMF